MKANEIVSQVFHTRQLAQVEILVHRWRRSGAVLAIVPISCARHTNEPRISITVVSDILMIYLRSCIKYADVTDTG